MKISLKPTEFLLIGAFHNGDLCDFAIIHTTEEWKATAKKRMQAAKCFIDDDTFKWLNYDDESIEFFSYSDKIPEIKEWLTDKNMVFVETDLEEIKSLPQNDVRISCKQMQVFSNGDAVYSCFESYADDEFWTHQFSLEELTQSLL
ncbi:MULTISPECIES: hypothetical protein [unclassified Chryseobacterium]|uniref:hypothetical protein n=1 Tax=unclassified Chryseobacterium TaxID=2593645 RepID=UPI001F0AD26F|nr:hypothetical protein [Chryseobacterium sp. Y16C]UMQ41629.1 hypothetical protein MKS83_19870 [Chryseobacterium sp. Y16C]